MKKELPVHLIKATAFKVDVSTDTLIQATQPTNIIRLSDAIYANNTYEIPYNAGKKNVSNGQEPCEWIALPSLASIDPVGMAVRYGKTVDEVKRLPDWEITADRAVYEKRRKGTLPTAEIDGVSYQIDLRAGLFSPVQKGKYPSIRMDKLGGYPNHVELQQAAAGEPGKQLLFLNTKTREPVSVNMSTLTQLPPDVVIFELPSEKALDPVGWALNYKMGMEHVLRFFPPKEKLQAQPVPLEHLQLESAVKQTEQYLSDNAQRRRRPEQENEKGKRMSR